ncbi:MAG: aminoacyl-tRNA hydrolase [Aquimarina sp.]|nr:aminoacyl-tRNA hydrolase [Aquimarina sp.]
MKIEELLKEIEFKFVRSSGPGGQNVNKVSSKAELYFDLKNTSNISEENKLILQEKLTNYLSKDGILVLKCDESRSQHKNKETVIQRFIELLKINLKKSTPRKKTRPNRQSIQKRLDNKKKQAEKKASRRNPLD